MVRTTIKSPIITIAAALLVSLQLPSICVGLSTKTASTRRDALGSILGGGAAVVASSIMLPGKAAIAAETTDVDSFLRSGGVSMPMGVSGQAGKAKPETGVLLREGTDISRDSKSGNVLAEILVQKSNGSGDISDLMAVVTSFQSPWPLGKWCFLFVSSILRQCRFWMPYLEISCHENGFLFSEWNSDKKNPKRLYQDLEREEKNPS
jgi:hypothetical protein